MNTERKVSVLVKIARYLNQANVTWAVGGSMLLYLKNITEDFQDIDIMVKSEDAEVTKALLEQMGPLVETRSNPQYKTKAFYEFIIDGVDVDVLAGFVIVKNGVDHDCALHEREITEHILLANERIPLHSVAAWRRYYELMGKPAKVRMIDAAEK